MTKLEMVRYLRGLASDAGSVNLDVLTKERVARLMAEIDAILLKAHEDAWTARQAVAAREELETRNAEGWNRHFKRVQRDLGHLLDERNVLPFAAADGSH